MDPPHVEVIDHFAGHALEDGSRLVVLPADDRGCFWRRASLADPPGLVDFPNLGVSEARSGWKNPLGKKRRKTMEKQYEI